MGDRGASRPLIRHSMLGLFQALPCQRRKTIEIGSDGCTWDLLVCNPSSQAHYDDLDQAGPGRQSMPIYAANSNEWNGCPSNRHPVDLFASHDRAPHQSPRPSQHTLGSRRAKFRARLRAVLTPYLCRVFAVMLIEEVR
jgi:hypothetical protein